MKQGCELYLISPLDVGSDFPQKLAAALAKSQVAAFQFRVKGKDQHEAARLAAPLQEICAQYDVAFVVNDDVALAKRLGADGVHLGQGDGDVREARQELGKDVQIGVTCHDSRHFALEAGEAGADYVAFGAFYPSDTKDTPYIAELELLRWWSSMLEIPSVAIGGITPDNAKPIIDAGADFIAVSGAVLNDPEGPAEAVARFANVLGSGPIKFTGVAAK